MYCMRYYRFNRSPTDPVQKLRRSSRKLSSLAERNRLRLLDSFYFENQTWGALHKAWKGYVIAKNKYEPERMEYYGGVIQKLQRELGFEPSFFPELRVDQLRKLNEDITTVDKELTDEDIDEILEEQLKIYRKDLNNE